MSTSGSLSFADQRDDRRLDLACIAGLLLVLVIATAILPNPYDAEGGIDAYIYKALSLNFGNLINRYGPLYFSYRSTLIGLLWLSNKIFGFGLMHKGMMIIYMLMISGSLWFIFRRHLGALATAGFCIVVCLSPWTLRSLATTYMDGLMIGLMFLLMAFLTQLSRRDFGSWPAAVGAGAMLGLMVNVNAYSVIYGGLIFAGYFAVALQRDTVPQLLRAGLISVAAFLATTLLAWIGWCAVLRIGYGTPVSTLLGWTKLSATGGNFDVDMFSVNIAKAHGGGLLANLKPDVFRMTSEGQVFVLYPLLAILAAVAYRLWAAPKQLAAFGDFRIARLMGEWNAGLCAALLVCAFAYVTSESMGNQMLRWTFYFAYLVPVTFLALGVTAAGMAQAGDEEFVDRAVLAAAGVTLGLHLLFCAVPSLMAVVYPGRWFAKGMILLVLAACVCLVLPIWRIRVPAIALAAVIGLGVPVFEASTYQIYQGVYSRDQGRVGRDIVNGQRALIAFTEKHAPPPGVYPASRPVLFWHPNTNYTVSLQAAYLSDYQSLHRTHEGQALPVMNETAIGQLRAGYRPEIVFICQDAAQCEAAHKAFRDLGVGYDVIAKGDFVGRTQSVLFEYVRMHTKPK